MLELDCGLEFDPAREDQFFAALPARAAVFSIEPRVELAASAAVRVQPYLLRTADLRRRAERLLRAPEGPSKRLNLREFAGRLRYRLTGSALEQSLVFYQHARALFPQRYRDLARLRPPALLKVNLANAYPRCYVTRRILVDESTGRIAGQGFYFGPFASRRAADAFAEKFLDLFKIRRCQIKIRRDPSFPGCIYSEMKMCLAPCFAGCTQQEYDTEVGRVIGFLATSGTSLAGEFEREREAASEALDFERAAALHRKLEKVAEVLRGLPELARRVDELDAVVLQRAAEENSLAVFAVRGGLLADPFYLRFDELAGQPRSLEAILRENLEPQTNTDEHSSVKESIPDVFSGGGVGGDAGVPASELFHRDILGEHLGLLARWFYSKPRQGEIFFAQRRTGSPTESPVLEWPYRKMTRACSRLLAPPTPPAVAPEQPKSHGTD